MVIPALFSFLFSIFSRWGQKLLVKYVKKLLVDLKFLLNLLNSCLGKSLICRSIAQTVSALRFKRRGGGHSPPAQNRVNASTAQYDDLLSNEKNTKI